MKYDYLNYRSKSFNSNNNLYLLALSTDGPVNEPLLVQSKKEAIDIYGSGSLVDAYEEASLKEGSNIYLVRVSGKSSTLNLIGSIEVEHIEQEKLVIREEEVSLLSFRSINAGDKYNNITIEVNKDSDIEGKLIIGFPGYNTFQYDIDDTLTIGDLVYLINMNSRQNRGFVFCSSEYEKSSSIELLRMNVGNFNLMGGADETDISKNDLYKALEKTYEVLEGQRISVICPYDTRFDDAHPRYTYGDESEYGSAFYSSGDHLDFKTGVGRHATFYEQLINFCQAQEMFGVYTHGVIGIKDMEYEGELLSNLVKTNGLGNRYGLVDRGTVYVDKGHYLSIFTSMFNWGDKKFNGRATYASMICSTDVNESLTMQEFPKELKLTYNLSSQELRDLSFLGAVAAKQSVQKGVVVANAITAGIDGKPLHSLLNLRMAQRALQVINDSLELLIGNTIIPGMTDRQIETIMQDVFLFLHEEGILDDFSYQITYKNGGEHISIDMELKVKNSLDYIPVNVSFNERST